MTLLTQEMVEDTMGFGVKILNILFEDGTISKPEAFISISMIDDKRALNYKELAYRLIGDSDKWLYPYDEIARGKTKLSARTGLSARQVIDHHPELLCPSDVKYWGNTIVGNIIVSCSCCEHGSVDTIVTDAVAAKCLSLIQAEVNLQLQDEDTHFFT